MKELTLAQFLKEPKLAIRAVDEANIEDDMQACKIAGGNYYLVSGELWGLFHQMVSLATDEEDGLEATIEELSEQVKELEQGMTALMMANLESDSKFMS